MQECTEGRWNILPPAQTERLTDEDWVSETGSNAGLNQKRYNMITGYKLNDAYPPKKKKDYTLLALAIPFALAVLFNLPGCYKKQDGCRYEGAECPNAQQYMREYQLQLDMDTVTVFDGDRIVGRYVSRFDSQLDSILIEDNR